MRICTSITLLLTLFVTCTELHGQQDVQKPISLKSGLVGFWSSESPSGESYVLLRKDGWFWALHKYSDAMISLVGGHWDTDGNKMIVKRLWGDKAFNLVPEKRILAFSIDGTDRFTLGNWPLEGPKFERCVDFPENVGRMLEYPSFAQMVYKQYGVLIPPESQKDAVIYTSVSRGKHIVHFYLLADGKFRWPDVGNQELSGTWKNSGDLLQLTGKTEDNMTLFFELKEVQGQYKIIKFEVNGHNTPIDRLPPPFQKHDDISLAAKDSIPEPTPKFFKELYQYIHGRTEAKVLRTRFEDEQETSETERFKSVFNADVNTGVINTYSKRFNEAGVLLGMAKSRGSYNPLFGVHFSIKHFQPISKEPRTFYQIAITTKQDPITTRWSNPDMALAKELEIFSEHVRLDESNSSSKMIVTRDGKEISKTMVEVSQFGSEGFKVHWETFKTEHAELVKKAGETEVEPDR